MNKIFKLFYSLVDRISIQEKIDFARHLAMVIKAGLPIFEGLTIIKEQTTSKALLEIVEQLMIDVSNGKFLADGLAQYDYVFGEFFINIVRVGEASGTLAKNLLYLSDELRRDKLLHGKVKSAMVYPLVILVATIAVTGFLTFFVFPQLIPVFANLNVKLPASTKFLIAAVDFLKSFGVAILFGMIVVLIVFRILLKKVLPIKYIADRFLFYVPVVSSLVINVNMVNFTRVLGLLLKSGVKIVEAITITADTFDNLVYKEALKKSAGDIQKGEQLATYLAKRKDIFPSLATGMIRVGENTGNLEENLQYLSEYFDEEVDTKLHNLTSLLEPLMLLIMGGMVGFVAISIITPIYSISQGIK